MKSRHKIVSLTVSVLLVLSLMASIPTPVYAASGLESFPNDVDPQSWKVPEQMTWDDWKPNPVVDWETNDTVKARDVQKGLVILVDYADQPFILTQEKGSDPMGNPVVDAVPENELAQFWKELLNEPNAINHNTSIHGFWRENSYGKWAIEMDVFGPYHLEGMEWEYGMDYMNGAGSAKRNLVNESFAAALSSGDGIDLNNYNFSFIIHAGYDESGAWQEIGDMKFLTKEDIPDEFGPSEEEIAAVLKAGEEGYNISWFDPEANWVKTRYVEWTSWLAGKSVWSHEDIYTALEGDNSGLEPGTEFRISVQGESDGMATFAHEFGHISYILDNYNNPYGKPDGRSYTGGWELMSRGSFSGPGGTHTRYEIPSLYGSSAPAAHLARLKLKQEFYDEGQYARVKQQDLYDGSIYTADIVARAVPVGDTFKVEGINSLLIDLEKDNTPIVKKDDPAYDWHTNTWGDMTGEELDPDYTPPEIGYKVKSKYNDPETGYYQFYSIEVVDRVGYDSFAYDSGVLITQNREIDNERAPFMWIVDSHPEDINLVDFKRPDGTDAMISKGDARQLADALFHAGTGEDVVDEYVDEYNNLHFYILDKKYDDRGILSYRIAVRSTAADDSITRGVEAKAGEVSEASPGRVAVQYVDVTNTGSDTDIFRLSAKTSDGWETNLQHENIEVKAGETISVPVYAKVPASGYKANTLTVTVTSESDQEKTVAVETEGWFPVDESAVEEPAVPKTENKPTTETVVSTPITAPVKTTQTYSIFTDIDGYDEAEAIEYVSQRGIMNGTGERTFSPDLKVSRAMVVTMLHRLEGYPEGSATSFTDVGAGDWYADAVAWAADSGIVKGYSETAFNPGGSVTREQMASILFRYAKYRGYISAFAEDGMSLEWATGTGILERMSEYNDYLEGTPSRAEVANMLYNFITGVVK